MILTLRHTLWKIGIFFSLFVYLFPFQFQFMPIPNTRVIQLFGILLLFLIVVKAYRINKDIAKFTLLGLFIFFIGVLSTAVINMAHQYQFALVKGLYIIPYLCSSLFIIYLMRVTYVSLTIEKVFEWVVGVTIVQAIISLIFFCFPNVMELYEHIVVNEGDAFEKLEELNMFRLVGIGSVQFANAATHYGITLWIILYLYTSSKSLLYNNRWVFLLLVPIICICGILSARTFFVLIPLTIVYVICLLGINNCQQWIGMIFKIILPLLLIGTGVVFYLIANDLDIIIEWVFEMFINMFEDNSMQTDSTDRLKEMYIFPTSLNTWIIGDGMSEDNSGRFYMHTDVGYIRSIYYWGILGSAIYYMVQFFYYRIVRNYYKFTRAKYLIDLLFIWFWIYNFKEFWTIEPYWALLLIAAICSNRQINQVQNGYNSILSPSISSHRT